MLTYIWSFMILISIIFSGINLNLSELSVNMLDSAKNAVNTIISITGAMCLWSGILKVAQQAGIIKMLGKILSPLIRILFPKLNVKGDAAGAIISNMSANMLGMGNAATPLGIKAMHELDTLNNHSPYASDAMCMFVVLNTASIQLIPTTMISLLSGAGGTNPFDIILPTLITSIVSLVFGVLMCKALSFTGKK